MSRLSLVVLVAACRGAEPVEPVEELPPAAVTCAAIAETDVDEVIEVHGVIAPPPKQVTLLGSPIAGRIATVAVEEGDKVAAGALLATIEDPALPAGSIEARAQVAAAKVAVDAAKLDVARQQRLVDSGIGARKDLDDAKARVASASAELDAANAHSDLANRQLARRELRASHAGVVLHIFKRSGETVDGTGPVIEYADITTLEVRAQVSPKELMQLKDGQPATASVMGSDAAFPAKIARVAPSVDAVTLLGTVRVEIAGIAALPVGSAATAHIVTGRHRGLIVPIEALRRSQVGSDELVTCAGDVAKSATVTIGQRTSKTVEIVEGLHAGDKIVVDHVLGLEDGQHLVAPTAAK